MSYVLAASIGTLIAGPFGGLSGAAAMWLWSRLPRRPEPEPPVRLVLLLLLVELRSGLSVLASLIEVSSTLGAYGNLRTVARIAQVSGLAHSLAVADDSLRPVVAQLARSQRTGSSLTGAVRRLLENDLSADRALRIARARTLPVRLMLPVTLLMLPGLVLFLYAPTLLGMFEDLTGPLT